MLRKSESWASSTRRIGPEWQTRARPTSESALAPGSPHRRRAQENARTYLQLLVCPWTCTVIQYSVGYHVCHDLCYIWRTSMPHDTSNNAHIERPVSKPSSSDKYRQTKDEKYNAHEHNTSCLSSQSAPALSEAVGSSVRGFMVCMTACACVWVDSVVKYACLEMARGKRREEVAGRTRLYTSSRDGRACPSST